MNKNNLESVESHFAFGENWNDYSQKIDAERIEVAVHSLIKLFGEQGLSGKNFLDIGCGSGLFSLAALKLGAANVVAVDIDINSINTTKNILNKYATNKNFCVRNISIFDINTTQDPALLNKFDIVFSWGVLHHTGAMYKALDNAIEKCKDDGSFCVALYNETTFCNLWKFEKKLYIKIPRFLQTLFVGIFTLFFGLRKATLGENIFSYIKNYKTNRGMSYFHDVRDWLGGYPYESISPTNFSQWAKSKGLTIEKEFLCGNSSGLFGTGCNEFVLKNLQDKT